VSQPAWAIPAWAEYVSILHLATVMAAARVAITAMSMK
jgi:hypothetical protein